MYKCHLEIWNKNAADTEIFVYKWQQILCGTNANPNSSLKLNLTLSLIQTLALALAKMLD